jgi:hypothetical protein
MVVIFAFSVACTSDAKNGDVAIIVVIAITARAEYNFECFFIAFPPDLFITLEIHFLFFTPQGVAEKSKNEFREATYTPLWGVSIVTLYSWFPIL